MDCLSTHQQGIDHGFQILDILDLVRMGWKQAASGLVLKVSTACGKPVLNRSTCEEPWLEEVQMQTV
jgi:hypothetical protein